MVWRSLCGLPVATQTIGGAESHPMSSTPSPLCRRQWLGLVSAPALAASLSTGLVPVALAEPAAAPTPAKDLGVRTYHVRDFGAKRDGTTLGTAALQAAIDACHRDGGGTVLVPAGKFHIGTVELKSNVTLHLAAGAGDWSIDGLLNRKRGSASKAA